MNQEFPSSLIIAAVIFDLLSLIPILGTLTSIIAVITFGIMGAHLGVSMYSGNRALSTIFTSVIEVIPFINWIPTWTIRIMALKYGGF